MATNDSKSIIDVAALEADLFAALGEADADSKRAIAMRIANGIGDAVSRRIDTENAPATQPTMFCGQPLEDSGDYYEAITQRIEQARAITQLMGATAKSDEIADDAPSFAAWAVRDLLDEANTIADKWLKRTRGWAEAPQPVPAD